MTHAALTLHNADAIESRCYPTEAQARAMLETARTGEMSRVERIIAEDAFVLVCDAVHAGDITWSDVMYDPHYVVAFVFDDYFSR